MNSTIISKQASALTSSYDYTYILPPRLHVLITKPIHTRLIIIISLPVPGCCCGENVCLCCFRCEDFDFRQDTYIIQVHNKISLKWQMVTCPDGGLACSYYIISISRFSMKFILYYYYINNNKEKQEFIVSACTTVVMMSKSSISLLYYFVPRISPSYIPIPAPRRSITESLPSCVWGITVIYHAGGGCCGPHINIADEGSFIEWIFCIRCRCVCLCEPQGFRLSSARYYRNRKTP